MAMDAGPRLSLSQSPGLVERELSFQPSTWQDGITLGLQRRPACHCPPPHPASALPPTQEGRPSYLDPQGDLTLSDHQRWQGSCPNLLLPQSGTIGPPSDKYIGLASSSPDRVG
ncbi:Hypothetical predicted protein [Marmota monax]|uniref:Uncharacterized protein n=1 Tax=Marmota monax TaxID=9995 RepID=A0A5E4C3M7_MARMO|nr:hypothetical protein GHT09_003118 [Marmota monax]VTJ75870.1 Hypothetical predicted protein [Marmota monax]